jgi:hypothetical protein
LVTWIYDEIGCAGAILDEFCIRDLAGKAVGWVFGLSVFSLKGEHIGWCEDGLFYDIDNKLLGFLANAARLPPDCPPAGPQPALPSFSKRPCVPALRGRSARPPGRGWSSVCLASYLSFDSAPPVRSRFMLPRTPHDVSCTTL